MFECESVHVCAEPSGVHFCLSLVPMGVWVSGQASREERWGCVWKTRGLPPTFPPLLGCGLLRGPLSPRCPHGAPGAAPVGSLPAPPALQMLHAPFLAALQLLRGGASCAC